MISDRYVVDVNFLKKIILNNVSIQHSISLSRNCVSSGNVVFNNLLTPFIVNKSVSLKQN